MTHQSRVSPVRRVPIPRSPEGFTPRWVTAALAGRHPAASVGSVAVLHVDRGTTTRVRLGLTYAAGTGTHRLFVKLQGGVAHRVTMGLLDMLHHEATAFRTLDPMPLPAPLVYATGSSRLRLQSLVVMEDLTTRGVTLNDATVPVQAEQAGAVVDLMARMHARYWEFDTRTHPALRHVPTRHFYPGWAIVSGSGNRKAAKHLSDFLERIIPPQLRTGRALTNLWRLGITDISRGPQTLLHGDTHIGNTYQLPDATFGFLDWQLISRGSWSHDVSYFLTSALDVETRRAHERALVERYVTALHAAGVTDLSLQQAWEGHRRAPAYGLPCWTATAGYADYQQGHLAQTTAERFASAYIDLETDRALASAGLR